MGTLLELYRSDNAVDALHKITTVHRAWWAGDNSYWKLSQEFGMQGGNLPPGMEEVFFESQRTGLHTCHKLGRLMWFMAERNLPPLWQVFGFESAEPAPPTHYRVPDWPQALERIRACRAALATAEAKSIATPDADTITRGHPHYDSRAHVQHMIDVEQENVEKHRTILDGFEEMIEWVLAQPEPNNFIVCWSW